MIRAYDEWGNVVDLVEHDKQVRADAIEEFKSAILSQFCSYCNQEACDGGRVGSIQECETVRILSDVANDIVEELKEQK